MTARHYDVIVLGRTIGALSTAALLARRDFRVLLLGQGQKPPSYSFERFRMRRRSFTLLSGASPVWKRMLHELAQSPRFRRRTVPLDPMFLFFMDGRRVEVPPDMELFAREVDREFPEVRQLVDELYASFASVNAAVDAVFERDAVWPPGTLWERLETRRAARDLPLVRGIDTDLLGKFPMGHPYREIVNLPAIFASDLASDLPPLALARLHGAWTRGVHELMGGEDELEEFLLERIEAHGGECRMNQRAVSLVVKNGQIAGVMEDGEEAPSGADAVVADCSGETLADLAGGDGITPSARRDWPRLTPSIGRFVVSLVVRRSGLPAPLAHEAFLIPKSGPRPDPRRPVVHLQRLDALSPNADESVLVAETLLPVRGSLTLLEAREAVRGTLREHLPFIDDHVLVVDSPHDGLPLIDVSSGSPREIDRIHVQSATAGGEPMAWQWRAEPSGYLDLAGEPIRGPIPGTYLVGPTVLPALGQEGQLLAAWGALRIISKRDRARQKMRRQMWTKIET
jgi:phytoene dehydrogenase-like protein